MVEVSSLCFKDKSLLNAWIDVQIMLLDICHIFYPLCSLSAVFSIHIRKLVWYKLITEHSAGF